MKFTFTAMLLAALSSAAVSAKTYTAQVISQVREGKTRDDSMLLYFSNNNGVWDASTNEVPQAWVKNGLGTSTVTQDLDIYQVLIVREGTMIIEDCTIKNYNNLNDGVSNLLIGGNQANLVLDNATYKQDLDYNKGYNSAIAVGTGDGAGTLTLQNGSLLHTDHYIYAGYTNITAGYVGNTTVSGSDYSVYSGGVQGSSTINVLSGSTLSAGTCLQFADVEVNIDGEGSQLVDYNRDSHPAKEAWSYLGLADGAKTVLNVTNGAELNFNQSVALAYDDNSYTEINVSGKSENGVASSMNVKGYFTASTYHGSSETVINITDGAEANFESGAYIGGDGAATFTVDEASKVSGSENAWMYLYDNGKFINEGKMEMNLYVTGGELTALDGATFGDIYADAGTITVEGTVNAASLTLASAADVDAQLKLVLGAGASLNVDSLAGLENLDEIIITIDNYTDGMIISSGHQYLVGADADTKVTVVDSEGNVLATNVAISTVPEPATATLSLLALAALAARRRRR